MEEILNEIRPLIGRIFEVDSRRVVPLANLYDDLNGESVVLMEFVYEIEDKFNIVLFDENGLLRYPFNTVWDACQAIAKAKS